MSDLQHLLVIFTGAPSDVVHIPAAFWMWHRIRGIMPDRPIGGKCDICKEKTSSVMAWDHGRERGVCEDCAMDMPIEMLRLNGDEE